MEQTRKAQQVNNLFILMREAVATNLFTFHIKNHCVDDFKYMYILYAYINYIYFNVRTLGCDLCYTVEHIAKYLMLKVYVFVGSGIHGNRL